MHGINAESEDSALRGAYASIKPEIKKKMAVISKKQFPDKKYGNNRESPTYFKIDKIFENDLTYKNPYLERNETNNNLVANDFQKKLNFYTPKQIHKLSNKLNPLHENENSITDNYHNKDKRDNPNLILPKIESAGLKNMNENEIRENYKVNDNRIIKYNYKPTEDYNIVLHRKVQFSPQQIEIDKWPLFYEK